MKTEIETRFLDIDKNDLISKLLSLHAIDSGETLLNDIIFYDKDLKCLEENRFIKLRKKGDNTQLIYKSNKEQKVDSAKEIEFEVSDFNDTQLLLKEIGWMKYRDVEKYRHSFYMDTVHIDIDTYPKIPALVELEGNSIDDLKNVAQKLGLVWENRFDGDPRFVYKKYGFDFDAIKTVTFDRFE